MNIDTNSLIMPPPLQAGDRVCILSPSSKIDTRFVQGAEAKLRSWGLHPVRAKHTLSSYASYAGSINQRLADFQYAMDDERLKAIVCSRGGYGAVHLLDKLDFTAFRRHPKWMVGFSDITALHCLMQHEGFCSLHAPMARHLTIEPDDDPCTEALRRILFGEQTPVYTTPPHPLNHFGEASGQLRGGNLAVFHALRGTSFDIPAPGTILFIEDVGERPHAIERMLYNLKLGGVLDRLSGLIVGQFTEYEEKKQLGKMLYEVIADLLTDYTYPICFNFPVGHVKLNYPLIEGAAVCLKVTKKEVNLSFTIQP